jgi:hypothetical protein
MSTPTDKKQKAKQWLWFIGLWLASLTFVMACGYAIKFLMSLI